MHVPRAEFEDLVAEALAELPEEFAQRLRNVEVVVEDWPGPEHYGERGLAPGVLLLGLYHGVPLTKRSAWAAPPMPDRITIFQGSIERVTRTSDQIIAQVRRVVLHEIAHHFGISDQRLRELGC